MRDVICNTSPLQYLYQIGSLHLLPTLFGRIQVPTAVAAEMTAGRRRKLFLPKLDELSWVEIRSVHDRTLLPLVTSLGKGEKEVLALGLETEAPLLVLDDRSGRRYASAAGLEVTGTLGVLLLAKERHVLDSVRPMLDRLQELRFRLSAGIRQAVLDAADERD